MFKAFGKLSQKSLLNDSGVGLGLTICKKLSESLGGMITLSSELDKGSTFTFYIKMKKEDLYKIPSLTNCDEDAMINNTSSLSDQLIK